MNNGSYYAGDDKDSKITPESAHQAAENANGRVTGSVTDGETADNAENSEENANNANQPKPAPVNKNSMMLVFGAIALIGVGSAGFFLTKKKNDGKSASVSEPDYDEDNEFVEEDDFPDYAFNDEKDDE